MKNKVVIITIIAVIMLALVIWLFAMTGDEMKVDKDLLMTMDGNKYFVDDLVKFIRIKQEESGDITKALDSTEMDQMFHGFFESKAFSKTADEKNITVSEEQIESFKTSYAGKSNVLLKYEITEEDYVEYSIDEYKRNELYNNFSNYYELSDEIYNQYLEGNSGDKKTYEFRIIAFNYEKEEATDEVNSGDVTEEALIEDLSGDTEDRSKETVLVMAQEAIEKVKNGEDATELIKTYGQSQYVFINPGYFFPNGDLQYATSPVLEYKVPSKDLYDALLAVSSGDTTELIEDEENSYIYFAKLESVKDGFVGEAEVELKQIILNELRETLVESEIKVETQQAGLMKAFYLQQ